MPNMSLKKNPMPAQEPAVRARNFGEVALGYTPEQAIDEAALRAVIDDTGYRTGSIVTEPYEKKGLFGRRK